MIPTNNQFIIPNESQSMQVPKIDHILAHASNPELSYIYARPELQASAAVNSQDGTNLSRTDSQTPKKGRPAKDKKNLDGTDKKAAGVKPRKPDPYDKYYLDNTKPTKKAPPKKVDLWSQEAWEDILNRKRKYFEFLKLTGELNDERSDDDGGQDEFELKEEEEFPEEHDQYEGEAEEAYHQQMEYGQNFEVEDEQDEEEENIHHEEQEEEEENNNNQVDSQHQIEIEEPGEVEEEFQHGEPEGHEGNESNQFSEKIETSERSEAGGGSSNEQEHE